MAAPDLIYTFLFLLCGILLWPTVQRIYSRTKPGPEGFAGKTKPLEDYSEWSEALQKAKIFDDVKRLDRGGAVWYNIREAHPGTFTDIYKGLLRWDRKELCVCVKALRRLAGDETSKRRLFEKEVYAWSKLNHRALLPLQGFAFIEFTGFPALVSEWMPHGSVVDFLDKRQGVGFREVQKLISDICDGLSYIHSKNIVHSDIKGANVVIASRFDNPSCFSEAEPEDFEFKAMICDFGYSREFQATHTLLDMTKAHGTSFYLAPELLNANTNVIIQNTIETDVWAFGMTVYEIIAGSEAFRKVHMGSDKTRERIMTGWLPPIEELERLYGIDDKVLRDAKDVYDACCSKDPQTRPSMEAVKTYALMQL